MRNIDLDELEIFRAVAETGAVIRAGERLGRVPSNVSTRLRQLEARLGTPLFERRNGRLSLSTEGRLLLSYADRILRLASEAETTVRSGTPRGLLRIGSLESTAAARLPAVLGRYHRDYPEVQVELVTGTSVALVTRVLADEIEAAFVAEPFPTRDLEMQHVFNERLVLITPRSMTSVDDVRELDRSTLIAFATGCSYRRRIDDWLVAAGCVPAHVMEFTSYHAIVATVAAGTGIAVIPRSVVQVLHVERQVALHPLPRHIADAKTQLVWRRGHRSLALDALRRAIPRPVTEHRQRSARKIA
ncbi:MAG TPA: LysR substrate-binding domain-containing protein [Candidatus Limnocylindria bacterium]|jgi:DNA-binding transcriptional LysR family regulator|nr:LysR substrate-binding domain-containing protein [Candidatus Limnocylindria bacterium]